MKCCKDLSHSLKSDELLGEISEQTLSIINDILDYSKIKAGKLSLESNEFELTDVLDSLSMKKQVSFR